MSGEEAHAGLPAEEEGERLRLPASLWDEMIDHADAGFPLEACGLLAGRAGVPTRFFPTANAARSEVRYEIDPRDLFRVTRAIEEAGEELLAIFHSHPATRAYPSATDVKLAYYPEAYYLIASLADRRHPVLRAFRIRDGQVREVPLERSGS